MDLRDGNLRAASIVDSPRAFGAAAGGEKSRTSTQTGITFPESGSPLD
ncbi:hypothetical protein [Streptomyces palmae]|nr:hypothetical protein [Streptomyces palmae]